MEGEIRGDLADGDQFLILQAALLANVDRTDIAAAVAFYALGELVFPPLKPLFQAQDLQLPQRGALSDPFRG
jgi:hypothetical protein